MYIFPQTYAIVLTSNSLLSLPLRGWSLWLLASSPIKEKIDLFSVNLMVSDLLLTFFSLLIMSGIPLFHRFFSTYGVFFSPSWFLATRCYNVSSAWNATWLCNIPLCFSGIGPCITGKPHRLQHGYLSLLSALWVLSCVSVRGTTSLNSSSYNVLYWSSFFSSVLFAVCPSSSS